MNRIAALGATIEAQQTAKDARLITPSASKAHRAANPAMPFMLRRGTSQLPHAPTGNASINVVLNSTPVVKVSPEPQHNSKLTDLLQKATRLAAAPVVDAAHAQTAPAAKASALIATAASAQPTPVPEHFPSLLNLVNKAASPVVAPPVVAAASVPVAAPIVAASRLPDLTLPDGAIRLPDGTLQFGYLPTGGSVIGVRSVQAPVPAEFGIGATFRRKGVLSDPPMTVTSVGDGVISANVTFANDDGRIRMSFIPDQLELITRAPGS